ncbi:ABC transporter substrate-binding protein [Phototrophicus methaneseepsis]|uniref:ABC transporter substrate-binding protein n=1 Tax=Phototrophicus methaneseepsis TaxID=2710758 RepID=A0A7S8E7L1_9CHLR|nr:ABC transporter substrate-binding protein [Phototrophicus methaneseepsis]QPC81815.1 ABC transporter substrate-binding protein [Phototrophicus methaneseepsis]
MIRKFVSVLMLTVISLSLAMVPVAAQDTPECEEGFHLFDHEYLKTDPLCIPDDPQRIVVVDMAALDFVLYTDREVVGATQWILDEMAASLPPLYDTFASIADLGYPVDTEKVLEVEPDIVLAYDGGDGVLAYDEVSQIAPVVVTSLSVQDWERTTQFWAEVLGEEERFQQMQDTYYGRIAQLQEALPFDPAEVEVSLTTAMTYGITLWMDNSPQSKILEDVGFARPEAQTVDDPEADYWLNISEETLDMANGDIAYLFAYSTTDLDIAAEESQAIQDFQANPLWQSLSVVQEGNVYVMEGYWYRAATYLLANRIIDDLFATLTDVEPEVTYEDLLPGAADEASDTEETAAATCEEGMRAVEDATGVSVCVPEEPQRILALMESDLDALVALGIEPIGTTNGRGQPTPPRYLQDELEGVEIVGEFYNPNLEQVLALDPDLILFGGYTNEDVLAQLNEIAPTINTFSLGETWQSHFTRVGEILNMQEETADFIASYDERVAALQESLGDAIGSVANIVRWNPDGPAIMLPDAFSSRVLLDVGFVRPEGLEGEGVGHTPTISLEQLGEIDGDWLFIGTLAEAGDAADLLAETMESPLFQALNAVQADHVVYIDGSLWTSIGGPVAAMTVLDDVEAAVIGAE